MMTPFFRKLALTVHITSSVGFLGAVVGFLALALAGLASPDTQMVRAAYLVMEVMAWFVIVPLNLASLLSGIIQSLGTRWGLFRHYWVLLKLAINVFATVILLMYTQTLGYLATAAATVSSEVDLLALRNPSPVLHSSAALLLLLVATTVSVYKPQGLTRYGRRKQREQRLAIAS